MSNISTTSRLHSTRLAVLALLAVGVMYTSYHHLAGTQSFSVGAVMEDPNIELDARLGLLLEKPILSAEEMARRGETACPGKRGGRDEYYFHGGNKGYWGDVSDAVVNDTRLAIANHLWDLRQAGEAVIWPSVPRHIKKRGLIMTGGNGHTMSRIVLTLDLIRNTFTNDIPVEIFAFEDELLSEDDQRKVAAFGDITIKYINGEKKGRKRHYIKGKAFVQNSFDEFIYLDSDSVPMQDIDAYFDSAEYLDQGSVFWPDLYKDHAANAVWRIIGEPCGGEWAQETGQVLFDRTANRGLNQAVLHMADFMQSNDQVWSHLSMGDKDTWRYAFKMLDLPTPWNGRAFSPLGGFTDRDGKQSGDFCGHSMLQWGLTPTDRMRDTTYHPEPGFAHTNMLKYHSPYSGEQPVFTDLQRARFDRLTDDSIDEVHWGYNWGARCFWLDDRYKKEDGAQGVKLEKFDDMFLPGREHYVQAIKLMAKKMSMLSTEAT